MNAQEAAHLCKLAKTISPAQAVEEFTPAAWALILEDVRFEDARQALKELGGEQEWIHVSHIVKRVKRIRAGRVSKYLANVPVPSGLDAAEYDRWYRDTVRAIGDGDYEPEPPAAVEKRRDIRELGTVVKSPETDRIKALREEAAKGRMAAQAVKADEHDAEHRAKRAQAEQELAGLRDRLSNGTQRTENEG